MNHINHYLLLKAKQVEEEINNGLKERAAKISEIYKQKHKRDVMEYEKQRIEMERLESKCKQMELQLQRKHEELRHYGQRHMQTYKDLKAQVFLKLTYANDSIKSMIEEQLNNLDFGIENELKIEQVTLKCCYPVLCAYDIFTNGFLLAHTSLSIQIYVTCLLLLFYQLFVSIQQNPSPSSLSSSLHTTKVIVLCANHQIAKTWMTYFESLNVSHLSTHLLLSKPNLQEISNPFVVVSTPQCLIEWIESLDNSHSESKLVQFDKQLILVFLDLYSMIQSQLQAPLSKLVNFFKQSHPSNVRIWNTSRAVNPDIQHFLSQTLFPNQNLNDTLFQLEIQNPQP
ncbi:hypothetical protein RFI_11604, partial [Reticulomyxa filosa]